MHLARRRDRAAGEHDFGPHQFAIEEDGRVVASIGVRVYAGTGHIGYWCARESRGREVVPRALAPLCRYGFDDLGLARLELITGPDNVAFAAGCREGRVQLARHAPVTPHPPGRPAPRLGYVLAAARRLP